MTIRCERAPGPHAGGFRISLTLADQRQCSRSAMEGAPETLSTLSPTWSDASERRALPAIVLTSDSSVLTAVANDDGYDHVFERQLEALARKGTWLLASRRAADLAAGHRRVHRLAGLHSGWGRFQGRCSGDCRRPAPERYCLGDRCACHQDGSSPPFSSIYGARVRVAIATNGAGIIHDFEVALVGTTS